jgi:cbb3-type cytochrome oxidase maturation protein
MGGPIYSLGWLFFLWAIKSRQYDDIEGPKYRMFDDEEVEKKPKKGKKLEKKTE